MITSAQYCTAANQSFALLLLLVCIVYTIHMYIYSLRIATSTEISNSFYQFSVIRDYIYLYAVLRYIHWYRWFALNIEYGAC